MIHEKDVKKLQWALDTLRSIRGANVRVTGSGIYIGEGKKPRPAAPADWRPQQCRVVGEENDYLVCVGYSQRLGSAAVTEFNVAKPADMRGGDERWGVYPAYVPDVSVIWAAPLLDNGAEDNDGKPIVLQDLNFDGRSAAGFWARVDSSSANGTNKWTYDVVEQEQTASGWSALTNGRSVSAVLNSVEANNDGTGTQGNSIDIDGTVFDDNTSLAIQPVEGLPVVWVVRTYDKTTGDAVYGFQYENAIDGPCG